MNKTGHMTHNLAAIKMASPSAIRHAAKGVSQLGDTGHSMHAPKGPAPRHA
tara:strand:+ start:166 stop:318 length:153 start_codon:yes stop_codon:yes gene_type:complete